MSDLVELVQALVRNACVNDGSPGSGHEERNAATLAAYLDGLPVDVERHEPLPGRTSLVARIEGSDATAPSLGLMGHIDVVPADPVRWTVDPFAAELRDGVVWGRGAVDMLNQTAAQAVAVRRLLTAGFRPRGDLLFFAPADEEAGGRLGAAWLLDRSPDLLRCDYLLTEGGGFLFDPDTNAVGVMTGEKGPYWKTLRFQGTPGHASIPFHADNALVKAAQAAVRLNSYVPAPEVGDVWRSVVEVLPVPDAVKADLVDAARIDCALDRLGDTRPAEARVFHACTHTTWSTNVLHAGSKVNVIASDAELSLDCRALPGVTEADVDAALRSALGPLFDAATLETVMADPATASPAATPLWDVLTRATQDVVGPARLVPWTAPFATDARFFRAHGTVAYGFTLHDRTMDLPAWLGLFHGNDERVSVTALGNAAAVYEGIVRRFLG